MSTRSTPRTETQLAIWLANVRVHNKSARLLAERLRPLGLSVPQHEVLVRLLHSDGMSQTDLGAKLLTTKGAVSVLVGRMVESGLLTRHADPADGRLSRLGLTDDGRRLASRSYALQNELVAAMFAEVDPADLEALQTTVRRLEGALDALSGAETR